MNFVISDHHFNNFFVNIYSNREFLHIVKNNDIYLKDKIVYSYPKENFVNESDSSKFYESIDTLYKHWVSMIKIKNPVYLKARELTIDLMNSYMIEKWNEKVSKDDTVYYVGDFAFPANQKQLKELVSKLNGTKILIKGNHDKKVKHFIDAGFKEVHDSLEVDFFDTKILFCHYPYLNPVFNELSKTRPNIVIGYKKSLPSKKELVKNCLNNLDMNDINSVKNFIGITKYLNLHIDNPDEKELSEQILKVIRIFIGTKLINKGQFLVHGHTHSETDRFANMYNASVEACNYIPVSFDELYLKYQDYRKELLSLVTDNFDFIEKNINLYDYYSSISRNVSFKEKSETLEIIRKVEQVCHAYNIIKSQQKRFNILLNYCDEWLSLLKKNNMFIGKEKLQDQYVYKGYCRNATEAFWDSKSNKFYYLRRKFSHEIIEEINHIEDQNGFDLFIPTEKYDLKPEIYSLFLKHLENKKED